MSESKSFELVSTLTNSESKAFEGYLTSSISGAKTDAIRLFKLLISRKSKSNHEIYKVLFPDRAFNGKHLRYIFSDLNKQLQKFILHIEISNDSLENKIQLAKALGVRNSEKAYSFIHHEILKSGKYQNALYFKNQFEHSEWHLNYSSQKITRKSFPDHQLTLTNLDTFYISKKLQLACEVTNMANILKQKNEICMLDEIRKVAVTPGFFEIPVIRVYYHILESLINQDADDDFQKAQQLLVTYGRKIEPSELTEMFQYIKNYCVRKINRGNIEFVKVLFEIYKNMLANKPLMKNEYLSQWEFKNIVTISLRLNEFQWCDNFIKRYINHLKSEERKNALAYNTAYYFFIKQDFHKAVKKLQEVEMNNVFYQLDARVILLKSYYELDDIETFFYQSASFRLFLLRNKTISDYQRTINKNLIKFLSALVRAGTSGFRLKRLKSKIEKEKNVADITWLLEKVEIAMG